MICLANCLSSHIKPFLQRMIKLYTNRFIYWKWGDSPITNLYTVNFIRWKVCRHLTFIIISQFVLKLHHTTQNQVIYFFSHYKQLISYFYIAMRRCHEEGNLQKKEFNWAFSARRLGSIMAEERHGEGKQELGVHVLIFSKESTLRMAQVFWNHTPITYLLQWGHPSLSFPNSCTNWEQYSHIWACGNHSHVKYHRCFTDTCWIIFLHTYPVIYAVIDSLVYVFQVCYCLQRALEEIFSSMQAHLLLCLPS